MKRFLALLAMALLVAACDSGGSNKQGPQSNRQDTSVNTSAAQCDRLEGAARENCERQTKESGTATPSVGGSADMPVGASGAAATGTASNAAPARSERGSGTEGTTSAGTTSGSQQPLSTGGTTR